MLAKTTSSETEAPTCLEERRGDSRSPCGSLVYLQSAPSQGEQFEEIRTLNNYSHSGFYFITERTSYFSGMQLHVIPAVSSVNCEFVGEVVRVEELPAGEYGVAVKLLRLLSLTGDSRTAVRSTFQSLIRLSAEPGSANDQSRTLVTGRATKSHPSRTA
jgi:hypothetical protein